MTEIITTGAKAENKAELISRLNDANEICEKAEPFFSRAEKLRSDADRFLEIMRRPRKIGAVILGLVVAECTGQSLELPGDYVFGVVFAGIAGMYLLFGFLNKKYVDRKNRQADEEAAAGTAIFKAHEEEMEIVPVEYWFPASMSYMIDTLVSGKADTLKEAMILTEEQMHRWKMEQMFSDIAATQELQLSYLKSIRSSSAAAAANSAAAAVGIIASDL